MPGKPLTTRRLFFVIAVLAALLIGASAFESYWTTVGYVQAWPGGVLSVIGNTLILGRNCTAIIADTSVERAEAIAAALANSSFERPRTYDSWMQVLKSFNITLEAVQLQRFDGEHYFADAIFRTRDKALRLDVMPSDAVALAVRMGAPIYVNATLLQEVGRDICGTAIVPAAG